MGNSQSLCQPANAAQDATVAVSEQLDESQAEPIMETPEVAEEEEIAPRREIKLSTCPLDPRFPTANASRYCYTVYNEYYKCLKQLGEDAKDKECARYRRNFRSLCPDEWIENWEELRANGQWFGKY